MPDEDYVAANRRHWDEVTSIHVASDFYDVEGFRAGRNRLHTIERAELGDVSGKTLLHVQCHFGLDTLSWARLGARVTGVDFSAPAIEQARALAADCGLDSRFIQADVADLDRMLDETFDIVFTSYGVLIWLPDIRAWARAVAGRVRPGGIFYIAEVHPTSWLFDDEATDGWRVRYPYFPGPEPLHITEGTDYADRSASVSNDETFEWPHTLGEIVTALIDAGLRPTFVHEFPYTVYGQFPFLQRLDDGFWHIPEHLPQVPLLFSLKALKPAP